MMEAHGGGQLVQLASRYDQPCKLLRKINVDVTFTTRGCKSNDAFNISL